MKKIIVIGGGITGCVIAYYLSRRGHKVEIYDQSEDIGGIMKDTMIKNDIFFSGPQYLDPNSFWIKQIFNKKEFNFFFELFSFSYASYTELFNEEVLTKNFAHPATLIKFKKLELLKQSKSSLFLRLKIYQSTISKNLLEWLKLHTKYYKDLHEKCADILVIGRVLFLNDISKVKILKKNNKLPDRLLGIPNPSLDKTKAILPKKGFNFLFKILRTKLNSQGIKIFLNKKIKIKKKNNELNLYVDKKKLEANHFVWTANPVPLIKANNSKILDNPYVKNINFFFDILENPNKVNNTYLQVFSNKIPINRIFIYKINGKNRITVEAINDKIDYKKITIAVKKIIRKFDNKIKISEIKGFKKTVKHHLYTTSDYKEFIKYEKLSNNKIISGSWHTYNRNEKINLTIKNLTKNKL